MKRLLDVLRDETAADRHEGRLRRGRVRRVHGARRRRRRSIRAWCPLAQVDRRARCTTIEGLARPHPLQQAFVKPWRRAVRHLHAGMIMRRRRAGAETDARRDEGGLAGNLCRCTGLRAPSTDQSSGQEPEHAWRLTPDRQLPRRGRATRCDVRDEGPLTPLAGCTDLYVVG